MDKKTNRLIMPLLIVSITLNFFMFSNISSMKSTLTNLDSQLHYIKRDIDSSINNVSYRISEALKEEASIINDFQYEYGEFKDGKVDLSLSAKPKEITPENKYFFSYSFGNDKFDTITAIKGEGSRYHANIQVPIKSNLEVDFIIDNGDRQIVESLDYIYNFQERLLQSYNARSHNGQTSYADNTITFKNHSYTISHYAYEYKEKENKDVKVKSIESAIINVAVNEKIVDSFPMEKDSEPFPDDTIFYKYTLKDYSTSLKKNDTFEIYILAQHEDGYKIRFNMGKFKFDGDNTRFPDIGYMGEVFIVE